MPKQATKEVSDIMLTRYACYLIAQMVILEKKKSHLLKPILQFKPESLRLSKRLWNLKGFQPEKLSQTEKELSSVIFEQTGVDKNFGIIRVKVMRRCSVIRAELMKKQWNVQKVEHWLILPLQLF